MRVSVVMAVRDGEAYLREAIESVLAQSMGDFEFLIVDDASTDGTASIVREYSRRDSRVRVLHNQRPLGPFRSANLALSHAKGQFVARQDADDVSNSDRLALQAQVLDSDPDICLVTGPIEVFGVHCRGGIEIHRPQMWQPRLEWDLLFGIGPGTSANVMCRRVFRGAPVLYPATHNCAEDYWLWCSLSRHGRVVCLPEVLYRYRQHDRSITSLRRPEQEACAAQIRDEYLLSHFRSGMSKSSVAEMVRFWRCDGGRPLADSMNRIAPVFAELRSSFLAYIGRRYGSADRHVLGAEIEEGFRERLGYWLFRSMRFGDRRACRELLNLSGIRRERMVVTTGALKQVLRAGMRRVLHARFTAPTVRFPPTRATSP